MSRKIFHHRKALVSIWSSLHEPREVSIAFFFAYLVLVAGGVGVLLADHGQLPEGVYSARMVSAGCFVVGGALSAPSAWAGFWWVERIGVSIVGFGFLSRIFAVVGMGDYYEEGHLILAVTAWAFGMFVAAARLAWVVLSPYRYGSGPMLPEAEASLSRERVERAERDDA